MKCKRQNPHPFLCKSNDMEGTTPWLDSQVVLCMLLQLLRSLHGSQLHPKDEYSNEIVSEIGLY